MADVQELQRKRKAGDISEAEYKRQKREAKDRRRSQQNGQANVPGEHPASTPSKSEQDSSTPTSKKSKKLQSSNQSTPTTTATGPGTPLPNGRREESQPSSKKMKKQPLLANGAQLPSSSTPSKKMESLLNQPTDSSQTLVKTEGPRTKNKTLGKHRRNARRALLANEKNKTLENSDWAIVDACGGRFIDQKPLLTRDESRLVCATDLAVHIYTTADSLLERRIPVGGDNLICCYALSQHDSELVYVGSTKGGIVAFNLATGREAGRWAIEGTVFSLSPYDAGAEDETEALFTVTSTGPKAYSISKHWIGSDGSTKTASLLRYPEPIWRLQVLEDGTFVASSPETLIIGKPDKNDAAMKKPKYILREIKTSEPVTCFEAKNSIDKGRKSLVVAAGGLKGSIFIYQDLLSQLGIADTASQVTGVKATRQLHWHREAVADVAFSRDGKYIISGGQETVLVLWQLDSGRRQFLPHLQSPIQAITLSPNGASYVIRLGDNSVMVMSAAELKPTANVASLQTPALCAVSRHLPELPTVDLWSRLMSPDQSEVRVHAALRGQRSDELLVAVPAYQKDSNVAPFQPSAPYLQTFNLLSSRHMARQALTRNNETNSTLGPEGNRIVEPDVKHLKVSFDGRWLATVDEWSPYPNDVEDLAADERDAEGAAHLQRTSQLRFWMWSETEDVWALNSRIESPHSLDQSIAAGRVLALAASPTGNTFATLGQDSRVRIWEPKTRLPNGKVFRGEKEHQGKGKHLTTWTLRREIPLEKGINQVPFEKILPVRASLAWSNDGSTIAATQHFDQLDQHRPRSFVHFLDPEADTIRTSRGDLFEGVDGIFELGFLGSLLIIVGRHHTAVWDVSVMENVAWIDAPVLHLDAASPPVPSPLLAVNVVSSTFAVAYPILTASAVSSNTPLRTYTSHVQVLSAMQPQESAFTHVLSRLALGLLPASGSTGTGSGMDHETDLADEGYIIIDAGANVRRIQHRVNVSEFIAPGAQAADEGRLETVDSQMVDPVEDDEDDEDAMMEDENESQGAERPVVRAEQLAQVFDHPEHAMPSMADLYGEVMKLYALKANAASKP